MKSVPFLRAAAWLVVFAAGIAAGIFLKPPAQAAAAPAPSAQKQDPAAASAAEKTHAVPKVSFNGTAEGLLRLAKSAGNYNLVRIRLYLALQPLPAVQIGALTESFPWRTQMIDHEYAAFSYSWSSGRTRISNPLSAGPPACPRSNSTRQQLLMQLAASDPDKALALARRITPVSDRDAALQSLTNAIGEKNPRRALELLLAEGSKSSGMMPGALRRLAEEDPAGAFAKAKSLTNNSGRNEATQNVLAVWAKTDPEAAREAALSLPEGPPRQNCLGSVFYAWAANNPAAAHAAALKLGSDKERQAALRSVINAWSGVDPAGAVQAAGALPRSMNGQTPLYDAYNTWAQRDPMAAAASAATQQLSKNQRTNVLSGIASAWSQSDPVAAMAWARSLPGKEGGNAAVSNVMYALARADGPGAAALWQTLPKEQRSGNLGNLMGAWSQENPDAALRFARSLERPQDRVQALVSVASGLDIEKPETISAVLNDLPAGQMRVDAIRNIFSNQNQQNSTAAIRWLRTMPENDRAAVLDSNYYGWGGGENTDPEEMKSLLEATPGMADHYNLWSSTAGGLAAKDPAGAVTWAQSLESPVARRSSTVRALQEWANEDPAAALAAARALPDAETQNEALPGVLGAWAQQDADAVLAWADTVGGREREAALIQGSLNKAANDPAVSGAAVNSLLAAKGGENPGSLLTTAAAQVAGSWARQDLSQASAWAFQLPESSAREAAVSTITSTWARLDPVAASVWVEQMPAGGTRDAAAANLSQTIQSTDPERAFAWASSIANESKREEAVRQAAGSWIWQDRTAARAIERAPVSENVKAALLDQLNKRE